MLLHKILKSVFFDFDMNFIYATVYVHVDKMEM